MIARRFRCCARAFCRRYTRVPAQRPLHYAMRDALIMPRLLLLMFIIAARNAIEIMAARAHDTPIRIFFYGYARSCGAR